MLFDAKTKSVNERIAHLEQAIVRAEEYLETGKHAKWIGFQPLFITKARDGEELPPHKDWVKNVFLRDAKIRLKQQEKALERLESKANIRKKRK